VFGIQKIKKAFLEKPVWGIKLLYWLFYALFLSYNNGIFIGININSNRYIGNMGYNIVYNNGIWCAICYNGYCTIYIMDYGVWGPYSSAPEGHPCLSYSGWNVN
jgi:hypothetical protein